MSAAGDSPSPAVLALGEAALTVRIGESATVELAERAAALADHIARRALPAVYAVVPAVASVTVYFDPLHTDASQVRAHVEHAAHDPHAYVPRVNAYTTHTIPVRYDGVDLDDVAARTMCTRDDVVRTHAAREYHVLALGFLPGWAYLGPLDESLRLPRRAAPRTRVPAGAVAIAGAQTGVYPRESPGGWHLIGSTTVTLFDPHRDDPVLLHPGDRVRFAPIA